MSDKKVVLITGILGGIGTAVGRVFIEKGYKIIATHMAGREEFRDNWLKENGFTTEQIRFVTANIEQHEPTVKTITEAIEAEGRVDVLVNNAGITKDAQFKKMTYEQWSDVLDVNLKSLFSVTQPAFLKMLAQKSGRIISISSVNGLKGQFGQANYAATKAGIIGFTKSLAYEGARAGVTANVVAPGYTGTPMVTAMREDVIKSIEAQIPMQRLATPEEIAAAVWYLADEQSAYITGETLSVNGGLYMH